MTNKTYQVKDMHCASCAMVIEGELEDNGVKAKCDYATQKLNVEFDEKILTESKIKQIVKDAGYTVA